VRAVTDDRVRAISELLARFRIRGRTSRATLLACAVEIARELATAESDRTGSDPVVALLKRLGPDGERIQALDPLGRNWKGETFAYWVAGALFAMDDTRPRWTEGPAMAAVRAGKRTGGQPARHADGETQ
jgi:hypothetical protein